MLEEKPAIIDRVAPEAVLIRPLLALCSRLSTLIGV